ncbi:MAG TPA: hypothetical protein VGJ00_05020 [Rhabdochlamydiaceae bacterium]|jgi:hypothetical protein
MPNAPYSDTLSKNFAAGGSEQQYYTNQLPTINDGIQKALQEMKSTRNLAVYVQCIAVLLDCMDYCGAVQGQMAGQLDSVSAISAYFTYFTNALSKGHSINVSDATDVAKAYKDLYTLLGGPGSGGTKPTWLSDTDQQAFLSNLENSAQAYGADGGGGNNITPLTLTPTMIGNAQTKWDIDAGLIPDGNNNFTKNPVADPGYTTVQNQNQQGAEHCTSLNNAISLIQKFWANNFDSFSTAVKNDESILGTLNPVLINAEKSS